MEAALIQTIFNDGCIGSHKSCVVPMDRLSEEDVRFLMKTNYQEITRADGKRLDEIEKRAVAEFENKPVDLTGYKIVCINQQFPE